MSASQNYADLIAAWALREPSVHALVLFGSRARENDTPETRADSLSDWDFQVITSNPKIFLNSLWMREIPEIELRAYAVRTPRVGKMPKVNAIFSKGEADFAILPARLLTLAKVAVRFGIHRRLDSLRRNLQDLSIIIRPGWRFLKGGKEWEAFYNQVVNEISDRRLDGNEIARMADNFVCDYKWADRMLRRGEFVAAQRILHLELAEANYRLLHELRLRQGKKSFPDVRRLEQLVSVDELEQVAVSTVLEKDSLNQALTRSGTTLRELTRALIEDQWHWPLQ